MRILLTNDDGINSPGLKSMAAALCDGHELIIVAPNTQRSACAHSITVHSAIEYKQIPSQFTNHCYSVGGTPADCVKLAALLLAKDRLPDLVISGINEGSNLGSDTIYSGTVSAALEAAYLKFRAIAVSLYDWNKLHDEGGFDRAAAFVKNNLTDLTSLEMGRHSIININYPCGNFNGAVSTKLGYHYYSDHYAAVDKQKPDRVQLFGEPLSLEDEDTDVVWACKNFATITPVTFDKNDYAAYERMKGMKFR